MHAFDRPLVSGLLALEQQFITADELVDAFRAWRLQPEESIGQILASRGKLSEERVQSLEKLYSSSVLQQQTSLAGSRDGATSTGRAAATSVDERAHPTTAFDSPCPQPGRSAPGEKSDAAPRFKPIQLHARGGLGHVFLAEDLELHRQVALKEIRPDAADEPSSRERFVVEAKITGGLEHPGIVPVYGLGVHADGRPFYAMRFIQGQTLSEAIKKLHGSRSGDFTSLEFRQLLGRLVDVCNAVAFAHSRGIVHRDLKPQNVMLGPFGETLVVDWGLAKSFRVNESEATLDWKPQWPSSRISAERESVTAAGEVVGTPAYMSPEQAAGKVGTVGPLSDVYSVGAILYALITGQSPRGAEGSEILQAVRDGNILPPRQANSRVPRALAAICQKAMAHDSAQRYRTPLELAADIERWLADEPVLAYREPWSDTAFRWVKRHRVPVATGVIALLLATIGLAVGYSLVSKERDIARSERAAAVDARDLAQQERTKAVEANDRAQKNATATRQVIEEYLIKIGDDRWSNIPGFEGVRSDMANLAVERYRDLVKQQPEDMSLVADAGMAMRRSANLYRMVGQNEAAEKLYDESIGHFKQAVTGATDTPKYEQLLCETLCDRALLTARVSGPKGAIAPMREALQVGRHLQARQPVSIAARQATARVEMDLADLLREVGQFDEAVRLARSAAATLQEAADQNARPLANRLTAALSGVNLGETLGEAGRAADAEAALSRALERTSGYLKQAPAEPNLRFIQARCLHELATVHAAAGDSDKASDEINQSVASLSRLADDFPKVISFRRKLAQVLTDAAAIGLARGEQETAAERVRRSIDMLEQLDAKQDSGVMQKYLASALLVAGEIELKRGDAAAARSYLARARESLARANQFNPDNPRTAEESKRLDTLASAVGP